MWWEEPVLRGFEPLLPPRLLSLSVKAYVLVSTGMASQGPKAGRLLEQAFYQMAAGSGVPLRETAGSRTLFAFRSCSGYGHEIDASITGQAGSSAWELKHLGGAVPKNDLMIFNSKVEDYFRSFDGFHSAVPLYRFLLTTSNVEFECRSYGASVGIIIIDPHLLPIPLLYEAVVRGISPLRLLDAREAAWALRWACRTLQDAVFEMSRQGRRGVRPAGSRARAAIDIQKKLSESVLGRLQQHHLDWQGELLARSWHESGGWLTRPFDIQRCVASS